MPLALSFLEFEARQGPADRNPVVVLHGLFGASGNWRSISKRLADRRDVFCLDARNHGSSPHDPKMDYPSQSGDVARFISDRGLINADIIGHSMGGKTAMVLALSTPSLVRKLVVSDIAPVTGEHSFAPLISAMRGVDLDCVTSRSDADRMLKASVDEPPLRQFILQNLANKDGRFAWRINLDAIEANLANVLAFDPSWAMTAFAGPVLFLRGARSDYIRDAHRRTIKSYFPESRIFTLENAGHWLHAEQPDAFVNEVLTFLDE